jgi:hypothetical protein
MNAAALYILFGVVALMALIALLLSLDFKAKNKRI